MTSVRLSFLGLVAASAIGCADSVIGDAPANNPMFEDDEIDPPGTPPDPVIPAVNNLAFRQTTSPLFRTTCDSVDIPSDGPSLVVHDPAALAPAFPLATTLQAIVDTSPDPSTSTPALFTQSILDSFNADRQTNTDARLDMPVDVRPGEASMDAAALVAGMIPVALFNRFDLAPPSGLNCGEYRIIYAMPAGTPGLPSGRFLLIFEAAYPNPSPTLGLEGCRPVADFWASLSDDTLTQADRIGQLEDFYYNGITHDGIALPAAINFAHFQGAAGQIRSNHFINFNQWQLREFRTDVASGSAIARVDTAKNVPLTEMFDDNASPGPVSDPIVFDALRADFRAEFIANQLSLLAAPELAGATDPIDIINGFAFGLENRFFEFQSNSQGRADSPAAQADANLRAAIDANLPDPRLSAELLLNRAGTQTCGGCHQFSVNEPIAAGPDGVPGTGDDVRWPATLGFVHVDESGNLSPALTDAFLPARQRILESFVCNPPVAGPALEMGEVTIDSTYANNARWTQVEFSSSFDSIPAVFINANSVGGEPCTTRIRNVTEAGFEVACVEPAPRDGLHIAMTVAYVAGTRGIHDVGGQIVEVECSEIASVQHKTAAPIAKSWQELAFSVVFAGPPTVLAQIQSDNSGGLTSPIEPMQLWMTAASRNATSTTFQAALDLAEVEPIDPTQLQAEQLCWLATDKQVFSFTDVSDSAVTCEAAAPTHFTGWSNGCKTHAFGAEFPTGSPLLSVGSMMSRNGNNGGWARQCSLGPAAVGYRIDEDQFRDRERAHIAERVGILTCSQAFRVE